MGRRLLVGRSRVSYRYLLGDSRREAARLRAQARLWDPTARRLFERLGVRRGWKVLEVGPGQGSLHMDLRRRVGGPIDAVERSEAFAARLEALCRRDGLGPGRIWRSDLLHARLPRAHYDLVFVRWVFLFLPDPLAHVRTLARTLKPGGRLAVEDYHRETFALIPRPEGWAELLAAERAFFATQGADVSVGGKLPQLFRKAGLEVVEIEPTIKIARPGSPAWRWLSAYFLGLMNEYAKFPPLTTPMAAHLRRAWLEAERRPASLMIAPAVLDVVGRKPRRREGSMGEREIAIRPPRGRKRA